MRAQNWPRLAVLTWDSLPDVSGMLLQSLAGTHRDVLTLDDLSQSTSPQGLHAVSGTFTHTPTSRRYIVAVCAIPLEADGNELRVAELDQRTGASGEQE